MSFRNDAIFWVEVERIKPNPFQPRRDFDEQALQGLADSIRQYGVLQPLVVTRKEMTRDDGGLAVEYELIAGERRLRACQVAGVSQVPVIIRDSEEDDRVKLELAIIENLQREDLNPIERARAFHRLAGEFGFKHHEIGKKVGKSREYVSNTIRLLALPEEMLQALGEGKIHEGHTRPLLMLIDRPEEQRTLFKEIVARRMNVREAEQISRRIAFDKVRKQKTAYDPDLVALEEQVSERLGARVRIEARDEGGRIFIDYNSPHDLEKIIALLKQERAAMNAASGGAEQVQEALDAAEASGVPAESVESVTVSADTPSVVEVNPVERPTPGDEPKGKKGHDLYNISNFSL